MGEWFRYGPWRFDVAHARTLTRAAAVEWMTVESFVGGLAWIGVDGDRVDQLPDEALAVPLIAATSAVGRLMLIDGWHRVAAAQRRDVDLVPVVVLTRAQTLAVQPDGEPW